MSSIPYGVLTIRETGFRTKRDGRRYEITVKGSVYEDSTYHQELRKMFKKFSVAGLIHRIQQKMFVTYLPAVPKTFDSTEVSKLNHQFCDSHKECQEHGILRILGPLSDLTDANAITQVLTKIDEFIQGIFSGSHCRPDPFGILVSSGSLTCEYIRPSLLAENDRL